MNLNNNEDFILLWHDNGYTTVKIDQISYMVWYYYTTSTSYLKLFIYYINGKYSEVIIFKRHYDVNKPKFKSAGLEMPSYEKPS